MADDDELYYLQPGFDLNSLTIPRIRSILVSQDVSYPASAKKAQLLEILEAEILPKSKKLLRERDRVRRTSKGITDVPSSQDGTIDGDDDDKELMPPPPAPKTPRSRKSKSNLADDGPSTPATARRSKTPTARKGISKSVRTSDTETDGERSKPSARKTHKSIPGPTPVASRVKIDEPGVRLKRESLEATGSSPFSDENPFQSGSPPPTARHISSTSRNRKSLGTSSSRKSTSSQQETTTPAWIKQEDGISTRSTYHFPIARINSNEPDDGIQTTEEFTPDAAKELVEEQGGQLARKRHSALVRRKKKPASSATKTAPLVVLVSILAGVGGWYRQEKVNIGYCGVGEPNWSLSSNPNIPAWVHENIQPTCEPCPQHAICYPNMEVQCEADFMLQHHPLSLNGLLPFPPVCSPDSEKERRIRVVADRAIENLRERRAAYECGDKITSVDELTAGESDQVKTVVKAGEVKLEIPEEALKVEVSKMKRKNMSPDEFEDLWRGALGEIMSRDEIKAMRDGSGRIFLSSSSLAKLPYTCALRRWTFRTISEFRIPLAILIMIASGSLYTRQRVISHKQATAQIPTLVATTLDRLATQAALKEDGRVGEGFIAVGQLRDDILRNVFSARERERAWQNVRKVVEGNSNVRAATREGDKTGEWNRVWEWIGPVDLAPGIEGRRSGGSIQNNSSSNDDDSSMIQPNVSVRRWDEGRPIY